MDWVFSIFCFIVGVLLCVFLPEAAKGVAAWCFVPLIMQAIFSIR